jgi:hypothetical protein
MKTTESVGKTNRNGWPKERELENMKVAAELTILQVEGKWGWIDNEQEIFFGKVRVQIGAHNEHLSPSIRITVFRLISVLEDHQSVKDGEFILYTINAERKQPNRVSTEQN